MSMPVYSYCYRLITQITVILSLAPIFLSSSSYILAPGQMSSLVSGQQQMAWAQTESELFPNATSSALFGNRSIIPGMHVMSLMNDVKPTWLIISSDNELSVNLRYTGANATSPAVSLLATALKTVANSPSPQIPRAATYERLTGTNVTQAGWISPMTVSLQLQGTSSLYDSDLIVVMIVPYTGPPLVTNSTISGNTSITSSAATSTTPDAPADGLANTPQIQY
jgi:hypothetical protein